MLQISALHSTVGAVYILAAASKQVIISSLRLMCGDQRDFARTGADFNSPRIIRWGSNFQEIEKHQSENNGISTATKLRNECPRWNEAQGKKCYG
jgi:hypothetical protein